jgi:hypothetical protein
MCLNISIKTYSKLLSGIVKVWNYYNILVAKNIWCEDEIICFSPGQRIRVRINFQLKM